MRQHRVRGKLLALTAGAIVALLSYWFGRSLAPTSDPGSPLASLGAPAPASAAGGQAVDPLDVSPGVQSAFDPSPDDKTEGSAVAAALRFLELTEDVVAKSPAGGAALQRSISTEASADRLAGEVEATLTDLQFSVPDGVTVHVAPLGTSARPFGDGWEVSVWYVEVIVYGAELAVEQWRTATYTVLWEAGEWRMADLVSGDGPTPVRPASMVASTSAELIAATAGLSDEGWGS